MKQLLLGANHIEPYLSGLHSLSLYFTFQTSLSFISPQGYIEERRVQLEAREAALPVMEKAWKELHGEVSGYGSL